VPDHTTLSRRSATLAVPRPQLNNVGAGESPQSLHLLVDSTGLKLCGAGEWLAEKHGTKTRRSWRKLHLGVHADTGQIVAATLTSKEMDDATQVGPLLDQVTGSLASVTAEGAYDQDGVYADVADRHPDAAVIVPLRCTAVLSEMAATAPTQRDRHLECIAETNRMAWQNASGYNSRAKVEAAIGQWKQVIGDGLRSRIDGVGRLKSPSPSLSSPQVAAGTPELCPHHLSPNGVGIIALTAPIPAPRWRGLPR